MSHITVIAFPVSPVGKEDELMEQFSKLVSSTRQEPGCLEFRVHRHPKIANRYAIYEKFKDQAAFDMHLKYPHTLEFIEWVQESGTALNFENWNEEVF